jgi:hypothetical protein
MAAESHASGESRRGNRRRHACFQRSCGSLAAESARLARVSIRRPGPSFRPSYLQSSCRSLPRNRRRPRRQELHRVVESVRLRLVPRRALRRSAVAVVACSPPQCDGRQANRADAADDTQFRARAVCGTGGEMKQPPLHAKKCSASRREAQQHTNDVAHDDQSPLVSVNGLLRRPASVRRPSMMSGVIRAQIGSSRLDGDNFSPGLACRWMRWPVFWLQRSRGSIAAVS